MTWNSLGKKEKGQKFFGYRYKNHPVCLGGWEGRGVEEKAQVQDLRNMLCCEICSQCANCLPRGPSPVVSGGLGNLCIIGPKDLSSEIVQNDEKLYSYPHQLQEHYLGANKSEKKTNKGQPL